jgi:putative ABC transport system ATP-binding protein
VIKLQNLYKSYRLGTSRIPVLNNLNFEVEEGAFIALTGKSGSGKSTLLQVIGLLDTHDEGEYRLQGELIRDMSETASARLRNKHIGFVFQSFNLLPFKSALDNVALPLYYRKGINPKERKHRAMEMLDKVGLGNRMHHLPSELSGGQKQRVAIARALITNAGLLLADEPTGALDSVTSDEIMDLFSLLNREGKTIILVTHDKDIASRCSKIIEIRDGVIAG